VGIRLDADGDGAGFSRIGGLPTTGRLDSGVTLRVDNRNREEPQ